ncbi:hypothetical protein [Methylocella sp.]|uniref:hypothetical protein n=1 Tax=Methylocella sp. TaxID=1978226 RepID=UPI003783395A
MKSIVLALALATFGVLAAGVVEADAAACARGVYRAGCVGPNGAVVKRAPPPGPRCYYRAGVRVCRY